MYKDSTGKYTTTYKTITKNTYNGILCTNKEHDEFPDDEFIDKYAAALLSAGKIYFFFFTFFNFYLGTSGIPEINLTEENVNTIT